ncbi:rhamnosyltransferase [Marmoricola sp. URHA0025 HA25]
MRAGVVFVLYNPTEEFLENLATARAQSDRLVAVDNTPEPSTRLHERLRDDGVRVIANRNTAGLAGAFNRGAEALFDDGADAVVLLDQDSKIDDGFLGAMIGVCEQVPDDAFILGPKIHETTMDVTMTVPAPDDGPERDISGETTGLFEARMVISSGSVITAPAWHRLGPFREDYFIEFLDAEYCLRARQRGVPVYVTAAATLRQTWANTRRHGAVHTSHADASRRYYMVRNAMDASRRYDVPRRRVLQLAAREAVAVIALERDKLLKLAAIVAGVADGARGRLGELAERRPRLKRSLDRRA